MNRISNVNIVSDGTANNTKIFCNGEQVKGVTKLEIFCGSGGIVTAKIEVECPEFTIGIKELVLTVGENADA